MTFDDAAQEILAVVKLLSDYNCVSLHLQDEALYQAICHAQQDLGLDQDADYPQQEAAA